MIFIWTTGIYPANSFEFYGPATGENWLGAFSSGGAGTLRNRTLLGVGL